MRNMPGVRTKVRKTKKPHGRKTTTGSAVLATARKLQVTTERLREEVRRASAVLQENIRQAEWLNAQCRRTVEDTNRRWPEG